MKWTVHFGVLILFLAWDAGAFDRKVSRRTVLNRTPLQGTSLQGRASNTTAQKSQQHVANGNGNGHRIAPSTGKDNIRTSPLTRHHDNMQTDQKSNSTRRGTVQIRNPIHGRTRTIPETATNLSTSPAQDNSKQDPPIRTFPGSLSSLNVLASFAGKNRVLVISAPHDSDGYYRLMMNLLRPDVRCEMAERHLQQIVMFHQEGVVGGRVSHINSRGQVLEQPLDPALVPRLMNFLKMEEGKFGMVLLKKNLRVEERYPYPVRLEAMYDVIDKTHMRKLEQSRQKGFVQRCKAAGVEGQVMESEALVAARFNTRVNGTVHMVPIRKLAERPAQVPKQTQTRVAVTSMNSTTTKRNTTTERPTTTTKPTPVTKPSTTTMFTTTRKPTAQTTKPHTTTTKSPTIRKMVVRKKNITTKVRTTQVKKITATTISSTTTTKSTTTRSTPTTSLPRKTSHWNLVPPTAGATYALSINRNKGTTVQMTTKSTSIKRNKGTTDQLTTKSTSIKRNKGTTDQLTTKSTSIKRNKGTTDQLTTKSASIKRNKGTTDQLTTKSTSIKRNKSTTDRPTIRSTTHIISRQSDNITRSIGGYKNQYEQHTTVPKHKRPNGTSVSQLTHESEEEGHTHKAGVASSFKNATTSHTTEREKKTDKVIKRTKVEKNRMKASKDGDGGNIRARKPGKKGAMFQEKEGGVKLAARQPNVTGPLASFFSAFDRRRRLLVITAPSVENRMYTQQRDEYLEQVCEMALRKISVVVIFGTWNNGTMKIDHYQLEQDQSLKGVPNEDLTNQPLIKALRKELGMTFNDYYMVLTDFDMKVKQEYEVPIAMKAVFDYIDTFSSRFKEMEQQKKQGLTCKTEDKSRSLENFLSRFRWRRRLFVISAPDDEEWSYQQQLHALSSQACNLGLRHMSVLKLMGKNMDAMGGVLELYPINGSATVEREDLSASLVKDIRNYFQVSPEYFSMLLVGKDGNVKSWYPSPMWSMSIIYDLVDSMQLRRQEMAIQQSLGMRCPEEEDGHHGYHDGDRDGYQHRGYGY